MLPIIKSHVSELPLCKTICQVYSPNDPDLVEPNELMPIPSTTASYLVLFDTDELLSIVKLVVPASFENSTFP